MRDACLLPNVHQLDRLFVLNYLFLGGIFFIIIIIVIEGKEENRQICANFATTVKSV